VSTAVLEEPQTTAPSRPHCTAPRCLSGRPPATHWCELFCQCDFLLCQPCAEHMHRLVKLRETLILECRLCFMSFKGKVADFVTVLEPL
jgi:hypothetical protein